MASVTPNAFVPMPDKLMSPAPRKVESCAVHEHVCLIYETREEQLAAVVPFFKAGLESGDRCLYVVDENTPEVIAEALRAEGVDVKSALASGALAFVDPHEAYLKDGDFDPIRMIGLLQEAVEASGAEGYTSFRITGETTWALRHPKYLDPLIEYECRLKDFFPRRNIVALCQYNRHRFRPETLLYVIRSHSLMVVDGLLCENPHYVPQEVLEPKKYDPAAEVERLLGGIAENAQLKHELSAEVKQAHILSVETARWRQLYEAVLANTPDLGYVFDLDHRFTYANGSLLAVWGRRWEDAAGKTCLELGYEPWHAAMHDREIEQVIATRKPVRGEVPFTGKNGRRIYDYILFPVIGPTGEVEAVGGSTRDITERKRIEEALRESEQRFRTIVDTTPECVKLVAADGTLLQMNPSGLRMVGADSLEKVAGKSVYDLIAPEYRDQFRAFNERICRGEKGSLQFDIVGLQGVRRHLETHAAPLRTPNGEVVQLGLTHDITESKRAEMLLLEQKRLLELIATGCPLEECLSALTASVKRLWPKASAAVLIADANRDIVDRTVSSEFPLSLGEGLYGAPISELAIGTCGAAIFEGRPVTCADIANDETWAKSWRELCVAHGVRAARSTPVFDSTGKAIASVFMCFGEPHEPDDWERNVGEFGAHIAGIAIERDRAMQALRESERLLETELADLRQLQSVSLEIGYEENLESLYGKVLDAAVAIMRSDFGSLQMLFTDRGAKGELRLLAHRGFNEQAARFWEWVSGDSESSCGAALRTLKRTIVRDVEKCSWMAGSADLLTCRHVGIRGMQTTPLVSRGGRLLGMISTHWRRPHEPSERELRSMDILARQAADLLDRKLAAERQKQSDAALRKSEKFAAAGRMAAAIAHEINNPLEAIMNLSYLLGQENLSPMGRDLIESLENELNRVSHITRQTLEFYRDGKTAGPLDAMEPINAAVKLLSRKAEKNGTRIETDFRGSAMLYGFPGELRQVFANLIGNALEAGATHIRIRMANAHDPDQIDRPGVRVIIADNGSGVPMNLVGRLFEPFFTTKAERGTGLGLWVSKGIVQKHEGRIRVRTSAHPERSGTTFSLFLPAIQEGLRLHRAEAGGGMEEPGAERRSSAS